MQCDVRTFSEMVRERWMVPVFFAIPGGELFMPVAHPHFLFLLAKQNPKSEVFFDIVGDDVESMQVRVIAIYDPEKGYWDGYRFEEWEHKKGQ